MKANYEEDQKAFPATAYKVHGYSGVAFSVYGWETQPTEETEWTGQEERTGKVVAVMVGDDRYFYVDPEDLTAVKDSEYCGGCGQIGCCADKV